MQNSSGSSEEEFKMPQVINTNIQSLTAQRNLNQSQSALQQSIERLSSGLRINSARDDAAGLAISERFTTQIRGLNQAVRNANDGISLAQTGEGALSTINSNLQRIRELAVQSANATNSSSDRAALDQEVQQRLAEIDRVSSQTSFNGQKILDGTFGNAQFQVGANVGETISVNLSTSVRTTQIGKTADYVQNTAFDDSLNVGQQGGGVTTSNLTAGDLTLALGSSQAVEVGNSSTFATTTTGQGQASAFAKAAAISAAGIGGLTVDADTTVQAQFATTSGGTGEAYSLSINGQAIFTTNTEALDGNAVATAINANASATGVTAQFSGSTMTLQAVDGRDITISQTKENGGTPNQGFTTTPAANNTFNGALDFSTAADGSANAVTAIGSIRLTASEAIVIGGDSPGNAGFTAGSLALGAEALSTASVTTVANAETTISRVDAALTSISSLRSTFGAIQNRFDSTIGNLATTTENLEASRSRIRDADFAAETAALTKAQILQQAGISALSQANAQPQNVLALLQ
ncbi:flagellin [Chromatocurvus halotolerans]|nr:flagellin [Chromatocurvus halotolerans]